MKLDIDISTISPSEIGVIKQLGYLGGTTLQGSLELSAESTLCSAKRRPPETMASSCGVKKNQR